uniref:Extracellular membrane protein CFEM domain-containing protein n=1 Tax=Mycena chlorophos TaxID=658473 RepID=A0ABQ0M1Y8_MYCCL|nr:predicted protein [Mycena chlorophos]
MRSFFNTLPVVAVALAGIASAVSLEQRTPAPAPELNQLQARVTTDPETCVQYEKYVGIHDNSGAYYPGCADITHSCLALNGTSIWSHSQCVAAAMCQGTTSVVYLNQCQNPNVKEADAIPNLSGTIWASIVGSCVDDGCPMTQQNFIDFVYGAMSAANTTQWPTSSANVVTDWWDPILSWTATGTTIPYSNLDDWLHYSSS